MNEIYNNIGEHNPIKECKILIVFDDMIADILSSKNLNPGKKLNISLVFIIQSYFAVPKKY